MTQEKAFEITRCFLGKTLRVDANHAILTLKSAGANFHRAVVAVRFGARDFEVEINRPGNTIKLSEINTHRKLRFDNRNPLNGFVMKDVRDERVIRTHPLDRYYIPENKNTDDNRSQNYADK